MNTSNQKGNNKEIIMNIEFEQKILGYGVNRGMLAFSDNHNAYINPITRELFESYKNNTLTTEYVSSLLESLK